MSKIILWWLVNLINNEKEWRISLQYLPICIFYPYERNWHLEQLFWEMITETSLVLQLSFWYIYGSVFDVDQNQCLSSRERKKCFSSIWELHESWAHTAAGADWGVPSRELHWPQMIDYTLLRFVHCLGLAENVIGLARAFIIVLPHYQHAQHLPCLHACCAIRLIERRDLVHLLRRSKCYQNPAVIILHLVSGHHRALHISDFLKLQRDPLINVNRNQLIYHRQAKFPAGASARQDSCWSYQGAGGAGADVSHARVLHCSVLAVSQVLAFGNGGTVILAVVLDNVSGLADAFNPSLCVD